ncbi:MAG TPA: hypothetical protein VFR37_14575 [Longimicrobium sp.]|nr:hypothetical protein [Longimicrobium sp.]
MKKIIAAALASLVLSGAETTHAQTTPRDTTPAAVRDSTPAVVRDTTPVVVRDSAAATAELAGPYRTDAVPQPTAACVRQVRRIPPPPSPRSFRRQFPLAAVGSIVGWFVGDRIVGPKGSPLVILSGSTLGAIAGSHIQAAGEGHANLGRSVVGGVLGSLPAGAILYLNHMDIYDEAETLTRGVVPVLGGSVQAAVTAGATSSPLQPARIQIIECPHPPPAITPSNP